jgi:hypothetical protein
MIRFIVIEKGVVLDTKNGFMWGDKEDGASPMNWASAKSYCENYRGGGYADWRMPTLDELMKAHLDTALDVYDEIAGLSDIKNSYIFSVSQVSPPVIIWTSETRGSEAAVFTYLGDSEKWYPQSLDRYDDLIFFRALPVRSGK